MKKSQQIVVKDEGRRRNGMVVAMLNRGGYGKHINRQEKRADMKLRRQMSSEY